MCTSQGSWRSAPHGSRPRGWLLAPRTQLQDRIIEIQGPETKEVLKKGCPFDFNILKKNNSINSTYNGITLTIDMSDENPDTVRLFALRSFGESLYHSITDASLEYGYKSK